MRLSQRQVASNHAAFVVVATTTAQSPMWYSFNRPSRTTITLCDA